MGGKIPPLGGTANTHPQSGHLFGGEMHENRFKPFLPAGTAFLPEAQSPDRKGYIIQHHERGMSRDPVKTGILTDGIAAQIHEGGGFDEDNLLAGTKSCFGDPGIPLGLLDKGGAELGCNGIEHSEPDIMPGSLVLSTGIPQASDETQA